MRTKYMSYNFKVACGYNAGKVRKKNEDNFVFNGQHQDQINDGRKSINTYSVVSQKAQAFAVLMEWAEKQWGIRSVFGCK